MTTQDKIILLQKLFKGQLTELELKELYDTLNSADDSELLKSMDTDVDLPGEELDIDANKMLASIKKQINHKQNVFYQKRIVRLVAIFLFVLGIGGTLYYYVAKRQLKGDQQCVTIESKRGEQKKVILPDSSTVWLNAETTIVYNSGFGKSNRKLQLQGQAFFDVTHNAKLPFVVNCNGLLVKVLGTKFGIEAYPGEQKVNVVLETGKVELLNEHVAAFHHKMEEGELTSYDLGQQKLSCERVNTKYFTSWREGLLVFRDASMEDVFERIERRYNVDIICKDPDIYRSIFTATISDESLVQVMKLIEMTCAVSCQIVDNKDKSELTQIVIEKKKPY